MKILKNILALIVITSALNAEPIKVAGTEVTFDPPKGFSALSEELIAVKWPSNQAPAYAIGTPTGSTTVAYDLKPHNIPQEALSAVQQSFTQTFEQVIPGIAWKKNEIIEHSGQKWLFLEMTSNAADTDIYNMMLITGFEGKMLVFNFNSTKEEFPVYEESLRASMNSIKLPN